MTSEPPFDISTDTTCITWCYVRSSIKNKWPPFEGGHYCDTASQVFCGSGFCHDLGLPLPWKLEQFNLTTDVLPHLIVVEFSEDRQVEMSRAIFYLRNESGPADGEFFVAVLRIL